MTVNITFTSNPTVYRMIWDQNPVENDVRIAFLHIEEILNDTTQETHIIVDLTANPRFPMKATLNGAMKINQHPRMGNWLVIGGNHAARIIGRSLSMLGRMNVSWYESEEEAMGYLKNLNVHHY